MAKALRDYARKRNFARTSEPPPEQAPPAGQRFVVQKHDASRLHYDFRLELDGVLKSWAVPKGPSLDPADRRLAVEVEDHPVSYGDFEGTIPKGEYGGGTVLLWDRGSWTAIGDPGEGYRAGNLKFTVHGQKLRGGYALVRMKPKGGETNQWLLIKEKDEWARPGSDVLAEQPNSVVSGRDLQAIAANQPAQPAGGELARLPRVRRVAAPAWVEPQLCTLVDQAPSGPEWVHEIKLDGYRMLALLSNGRARLLSRRENDWTTRFAPVARAVEGLPAQAALLDGEVVALDKAGRTDFQTLQNARHAADLTLVYYAFDLLHLDGYDLREAPLRERRRILSQLLAGAPAEVRLSREFEGEGPEILRHVCELQLEGLISKRADSPYRSGRGGAWVKAKCLQNQEFVVGGFTDPRGGRTHLGSLLLGYYQADRLVYCGQVGTGFNRRNLPALLAQLRALEQERPPFANLPPRRSDRATHWVAPELVAQVEFTGWTADRRLRHPSFQGLREDKRAAEVVRELPAAGPPPDPAPPRPGSVKLTTPERVLYPELGLTKGRLADFYVSLAEQVLPHVADRPLSLVRCPQGRTGQCFFQKHLSGEPPPGIAAVMIEQEDGAEPYAVIRSLDGLLSLVQLNVLEIHPWGSRADTLERPDRLVFDLDPAEGLPWSRVVSGAREIREVLASVGLESYVKTSGGKGLHVMVPVLPEAGWDQVREFCRAVAEAVAARAPDRYTVQAAKARRVDRIFIDWLRNARGATSVAAYVTRAREGAPVSTPVRWDELGRLSGGNHYTVANLPRRLSRLDGDPWEGFAAQRQSLREALRKLG